MSPRCMRCLGWFLMLVFLSAAPSSAQSLARIHVSLQPDVAVEVPRAIDLDGVTFAADSALSLFEVRGEEREPVPLQVRAGSPRTLHWVQTPGASGVYEVVQVSSSAPMPAAATVRRADGQLAIQADDALLLAYQYGVMPAPDGIDSAYARSGFVHPLNTPAGFTLTRIQPPDHYHHYGLWNPWTQVEYRGSIVDFWNLARREGTVRFAGFASVSEGPVFSEFEAVHEHVVYRGGGEEVALNELQRVRVYPPTTDGRYVVDVTSILTCATEHPVRLLEYRYGGFGWRGPQNWTHANSWMLSSEGRTRVDADGSRARWLRVQGEAGEGEAGMLLMSHPSNYNHPEPLRVWPPEDDDGAVFVNISPTKDREWLLEPGRRHALRYRLVVYDGHLSPEAADAYWHSFADTNVIVQVSRPSTRTSTSP